MPVKKPGLIEVGPSIEVGYEALKGLSRFDPGNLNNLLTRTPRSGPVLLKASTTLRPNGPGEVNKIALANPTQGPMLIDEIRFTLHPTSNVGQGSQFGGIVAVKFVLGQEELMANEVPLWLLGPAWASFWENVAVSDYNQYRWKLRKPIVIPPGGILAPFFQHRGFSDKPIDVTISYIGRVGVPMPDEQWLPWVSPFISKQFDFNDVAQSDASTELDLRNPFSEPIEIERFVGRTMTVVPGVNPLFGLSDAFLPDFGILKLMTSTGYMITPDSLLWADLFDQAEHAFHGRFTLDPGAYILAEIDSNSVALPLGPPTYSVQFQIAMLGWRQVK